MGYQHDFDEELGEYFYGDPPLKPNAVKAADVNAPIKAGCKQGNPRPPVEPTSTGCRRRRDEAYWSEAGDLLFEYFALRAGTRYSDALVDGFVGWLGRSPAEFKRYVEGDDMARAALVDWYLKVVL
jgi:hypothetical protein